jgi:hypothetical protein
MRFLKILLLPFFLLYRNQHCAGQPKTDSFLEKILFSNTGPIIHDVLNHKDSFRVQIIYTQINRDAHNKPFFNNYYYNVDTNLYFNPASTVKLPLALLSLEKLNKLHLKGIDKFTSLQIDSNYPWQTPEYTDSTAETGFPSITHYIKKAFLVSDNDAYNRMYQFVGQQTINRNLHAKGYNGTRIVRQFLDLSAEQNRHTNSIRFINYDGSLIYTQPAAYNSDSFYFGKTIKIGKGHFNNKDSLINEPMDFSRANNLPLEDLQQMLQSVMFPQSVPAAQRFHLSEDDYSFLYKYLSQYPAESNYPKYDSSQYVDSYVKFYFKHASNQMPSYMRVFNKAGWSYGFLIDVSYVVDFKNNIEYMLTTSIYVNSDGIINDDKYDYDKTGWPFMNELGETIYQFELKRPRKYKPDLTHFKLQYEHRDVNDTRPVLKNVDN